MQIRARAVSAWLSTTLPALSFALAIGAGTTSSAAPATTGAVAAAGAKPALVVPELPFEKYQLPNGLQVILHHDGRLPLVAINIVYDVGGRQERPGRSGFAHLFEHMMFQGSKHVGEGKHFYYLEEAGASDMNATTEFDRTNYFETVPRDVLELALWLESDRMGWLLPMLTKARLDNQVDVVKNERRQSIENHPYGLMQELIIQTIYPPTHPYHGNVIGSMEDLSAADVKDVSEFFETYYTPANATLAIAGDFDPAKIRGLVEKYFGPIKGRPKPAPVTVAAPTIPAERKVSFPEPVATLPKLSLVWMGPSAFQPGTAELELLGYVLSGTKSSRLDRRVAYDDQIAQSVGARFSEEASGSLFELELVLRPGRTLEEAQKATDEVLADLRKHPVTELELKRANNAFQTAMIQGLEPLAGRAERLQVYNLYLGDPGKLAWDLQRYAKVTSADLARVVQEYLTDKRLIVYATPAAKASNAASAAKEGNAQP